MCVEVRFSVPKVDGSEKVVLDRAFFRLMVFRTKFFTIGERWTTNRLAFTSLHQLMAQIQSDEGAAFFSIVLVECSRAP